MNSVDHDVEAPLHSEERKTSAVLPETYDDYPPPAADGPSTSQRAREACDRFCSVDTLKQRIPIISWLPHYTLNNLQGDIVAGLTVGLMVIPQGLAYAKIAGLPEQYGLYSAFMGCFVYCFFGSSKDITLGPTAIISLLTDEFASKRAPDGFAVPYATVLTLMCGLVQFVMGCLHLGIIVSFISHPVISAFTSAAAITIAAGQVKNVLGLKNIPREFMHMVYETFANIKHTNFSDLVLGVICMVILVGMKFLKDRKLGGSNPSKQQKVLMKIFWFQGIARNALVVLLAAAVTPALQGHSGINITTVQNVEEGMPHLHVPHFSITVGNDTRTASQVFSDIAEGFAVVPLLGLVETIAIGRVFAKQNHYKIEPTQELLAIGLSNVVSCFVGSYPVTGSFSRTAVNSQSGVKTPAAGVITGGVVLFALGVLAKYFRYIPEAALAAVIITAVLQMTDFKILIRIWKVKKLDLLPWGVTFILSFVLSIENGILVGIGVSLLLVLYPQARPKITHSAGSGLQTIKPTGDLQFPAVDYVFDEALEKATQDGSWRVPLVIDCQQLTSIDFSTVEGLIDLQKQCNREDVDLILCNLDASIYASIKAANLERVHLCASFESAQSLAAELRQLATLTPTSSIDEQTSLLQSSNRATPAYSSVNR